MEKQLLEAIEKLTEEVKKLREQPQIHYHYNYAGPQPIYNPIYTPSYPQLYYVKAVGNTIVDTAGASICAWQARIFKNI